MIFLFQLILFVLALFGENKLFTLVVAIASCILPDEIPFVDEIMYLAMAIRRLLA